MNFQKNDYFLRWSTNGPQVSKNVCSALERILSIWIIFVISLSHFLKHGGFWGFSSPEESSSWQRPYQALASVVPQMNNRCFIWQLVHISYLVQDSELRVSQYKVVTN